MKPSPRSLREFLDPETSPLPAWLLWCFSGYFLLNFIFISCIAMSYPYIIEWLEGTTMQIVERAAEGLPIYTEPTVSYTPFMYTPLYYYVAAWFSLPMGMDFPAGRLVSILSSFGCCAVIYHWMRFEKLSMLFAFTASALFLAMNSVVGGWLHIARVDMLFMFLLLAGLYCYVRFDKIRMAALTSIFFTLAIYTKQQAAIVIITMLITTAFATPKKAGIVALITFTLSGLWFCYYQHVSEGWFVDYVYTLPKTLPVKYEYFWAFWERDIFKVMPVMLGFSTLAVVLMLARDWKKGLFYLGILAGALGASLGSRMHVLGWFNVLMPAYSALIIAGMAAIGMLIRERLLDKNIAAVLIMIQMLLLFHTPYDLVPDSRQREITEQYFDYIGKLPGEVLIPDLQFVQSKVGKKSYAYRMNAVDVMKADWGDKNYVKEDLKREMENLLKKQYFSAILMPNERDLSMKNQYYSLQGKILDNREAPFINGAMQYPNLVYLPKQTPQEP